MDHLVAEFSFGNLPHHESEKAMRLFADRVLPPLQHDPASATPKPIRPAAAGSTRSESEDLFAPA